MNSKLNMLLVGAIVAISGNALASVVLVNGGFESVIGDTGATTINGGGWTDSVGNGMAMENGTYADGSATADLPGWTGTAGKSVVANQGPRTGSHNIAINGAPWGNPAGAAAATTVLSDSMGASDGTALTISLWASGTLPVVFDLLANGTPVAPTSFVDPAQSGAYSEFTRTYDAAAMGAVNGLDLTIQFGLAPTGTTGGQNKFDDLTVTVVPEPATMSLLAFGGLALLRRKRH